MLDAGTACKHGFAVGDTIQAPPAPARRSPTRSPASPATARSTRSAAPRWRSSTSRRPRRCSTRRAPYDSISVKAKDGVSPAALTQEIKPLLPASAEVKTGDAQAAADSKDTNESLKFITYFLLGFGGIALFVGAFVILNTLSITVAQRSREFATLRTLGASRRQVMRSVVLEGLIVGIVASVLGLVLGLGIAKGMSALFAAMGVDLPKSGTVLADPHDHRQHAHGHARHARGQHRPGAARHPRAADLGGPRGLVGHDLGAPGRSPSPALVIVGVALALIGLGLFGGVAAACRAHARRRRARAVRRHRHARPADREAARLGRRPPAARWPRPAGSPARTRSATPGARPPRPPR